MKLRVGVVQAASARFDFEATLHLFRSYAENASKEGVQLLVFPEAFFGGYPKHTNFGAVIGSREDQGRINYAAYVHGAITFPSERSKSLQQVAADTNMAIAVGVIERDGSTLYCALLYLDPTGKIVGKHRKLVPTASERLIWANGDGSEENLRAHTLNTANGSFCVGGAICWENLMPLFRYALYKQGIEVYIAPTVDARETWLNSMIHIAMESRCFVLSANQFAKAADFPDWLRASFPDGSRADEDVIIGGGSCIVSPLGQVLVGPLRGVNGLLMSEVDLDDIHGARFDFDPTGHYARPQQFRALHTVVSHEAKYPSTPKPFVLLCYESAADLDLSALKGRIASRKAVYHVKLEGKEQHAAVRTPNRANDGKMGSVEGAKGVSGKAAFKTKAVYGKAMDG
ncbi:Nitrilase [Podochytrium sp. JEL0797]|nr:Nitrilase [Podochytrium sp. JEL0797]